MILYEATVEDFTVIPYVRMTRKGKWKNKRAQRYLETQSALAWEFKAQNKRKEPIDEPCVLSYTVHLPHKRRVDDDNIRKALQDALQYAGVIENDCLIKGTDKTRTWQDGKNRIVVVLTRLEE